MLSSQAASSNWSAYKMDCNKRRQS